MFPGQAFFVLAENGSQMYFTDDPFFYPVGIMMNDKFKGFLLGAVAAATYGMNPLFALPLYQEGLEADSVLFYRYSMAVAMLGMLMKFQRQSFRLKKNEVLPLIIGGLLFAGS